MREPNTLHDIRQVGLIIIHMTLLHRVAQSLLATSASFLMLSAPVLDMSASVEVKQAFVL